MNLDNPRALTTYIPVPRPAPVHKFPSLPSFPRSPCLTLKLRPVGRRVRFRDSLVAMRWESQVCPGRLTIETLEI